MTGKRSAKIPAVPVVCAGATALPGSKVTADSDRGRHAGGASVAVWLCRAMYFGVEVSPAVHQHKALQISVSLGPPLRVRSRADDPYSEQQSFIASPNVPHQFERTGTPVFLLYCESRVLADFARHLSITSGSSLPALPEHSLNAILPVLQASGGHIRDEQTGHAIYSHILKTLIGSVSEEAREDPRIAVARSLVTPELLSRESRPAERLAASVHLSPSRFRHLFRSETGVSVQSYLLWKRLITALVANAQGLSLTDAALRAGFADSAHLSRVCRSMFGMQPSRVFRNGQTTEVIVSAEFENAHRNK